jgi:hypothetical protein
MTTTKVLSLDEYKELLNGHNWHYEYSLDPRVVQVGKETYKQLYYMSKKHSSYYKLWSKANPMLRGD